MKLETISLTELDHTFLWHPFTQMKEWLAEEPLVIERGEGVYLWDNHGKRYIDATSSIWCAVHGHNHPRMNQAVSTQLSKVAHSTLLGLSNVPSILLAEKLSSFLPKDLCRIFYSDSGAGAVETALKMAVQYWHLLGEKRTSFLSLEGAYHGDTFGSMSVGYSDAFHQPFQSMLFDVYRIKPPYLYARENNFSQAEAEEESLVLAEEFLEEYGSEIAACIVEPMVQGASGIWPHSSDYLKSLFQIVKSHGCLFIADEVAVGFGRTGKFFAVDHADVTPDILCLGKALSGGYLPLSATITTEEIFKTFQDSFEEFKHFFHGHTFSGNPLACAAGIASLEIFKEEDILAHLAAKIHFFWNYLSEKIASLPFVREVRGHGLFAGIELGKNKEESYPVDFRIGKKVMMAARNQGILLRPLLDTLVLAPPLNIPNENLEELLKGVKTSIKEVCS